MKQEKKKIISIAIAILLIVATMRKKITIRIIYDGLLITLKKIMIPV